MKYIEELNYGQIFVYEKQLYVLTNNFKEHKKQNQKQHMCTALNTGCLRWLESTCIVDNIPVFYQDHNNIIHPIDQPYDTETNL
jgi:hypothetical protein